jgi:hypothetical protein
MVYQCSSDRVCPHIGDAAAMGYDVLVNTEVTVLDVALCLALPKQVRVVKCQ